MEEGVQISEEEEEQFDKNHEDLIRERMAPLIDRIIPFETTDENHFNGINSKITIEEIQKIIKETKQRAPGMTGITKRHITDIYII